MKEWRFRVLRSMLTLFGYRSLVYIEGEASMNKFTGKDGSAQQSLSIVQREFFPRSRWWTVSNQ